MSITSNARPSRNRRKNSLFGRILQKIKGSPKTVEVENKKQSRLTHFQITKIYRLWDEPNKDGSKKYSLNQISIMVGASQGCIRYWIDKRDEQKPGITKSSQAIDKTLKQGEEDVKFDENGKWIPIRKRKQQSPTTQAPPTETKAEQALDALIVKDKWWVESQSNPAIFSGAKPEENWKDQRWRNNIGRVVKAKIIKSKEEALKIPREDVAKAFERHSKKEPVEHHGTPHIPNRCCCGINEPEWVKVFPVNDYSAWTTNNRRQNWEKKKLGERLRSEEEARNKNKEPEYFCSECNSKISKDQSNNTSQKYGRMFCPSHEPDRPRGGFML